MKNNDQVFCKENLLDKKSSFLSPNFIAICLLIIFLMVSTTSFFSLVIISGSSMYPTLSDGDVVIMVKTENVKRGDVVVIDGEKKVQKNGQQLYEWIIKRIIAVGGDTIDIKDDGAVYIKFKGQSTFEPLDEEYLETNTKTEQGNGYLTYPFTVPEGELFFLGDNRGISKDSRSEFGTCKQSQIKGIVRQWAINSRGFFTAIYKFENRILSFFNK